MQNDIAKLADSILEMRNDLKALRAELAKSKQAKQIENLENDIAESESNLVERLTAAGVEGIVGETASAELQPAAVYEVVDVAAFTKWIFKTKSLDVLGMTPKRVAIEARFSDGVSIPGIERTYERKLSVRKRGAK